MSRRIRILPDRLVNQIAAGEVVERPASVVKELVENAIDAGASRVSIEVRNGGKTEIRVADDGSGMGREDALLSLDRHATSKISESTDLNSIRTLGFRGEALPSIASISRMVIETALREGDGTRLVISGGQLNGVESIARQRGTTILVKSLFFNVPARAKFLRSAAAETRALNEIVITLAMANPEVTIELTSNGRKLLDLPSAPELNRRISSIWGDELAGQLIPVTHRDGGAALTGLIERPRSATPRGRRAYLFVNGRPFSNRYLVRAADRGYRTTIAPGIRPSIFLFIEVADGQVDVNVHPTKAEVRFRDGIGIERMVEEGVRATLQGIASTPNLGRAADPPPLTTNGTRAPAAPAALPIDQMSLFVAGSRANPSAEPATIDAPSLEVDRHPPTLWQVHNTYIFAQTRSGMVIVDQHSAHERVLYEELMTQFDQGEVITQRLLFPLTLRLSPGEYTIAEELGGLFARMGFEIEPFGAQSVIVHGVPMPHAHFDAERCLREMIAELTAGSQLVNAARNQHERMGLSFACKAAIKAGQKLSPQEMSELFDKLFATELPYHDIHGRPTVIQLSLAELHNRFGRSG